MRPFLIALQFLTVVPVHLDGDISPRDMGRAMAWFPVVGLLLGACLLVADVALQAALPPVTAAALLLTVWAALTGGLHLDGFMDCCDGLLVTRAPEQRLEILRDPHAGSFAVVGVVCLLLAKFAALLELAPAARPAALLVIPAVSRAAMVWAARAYSYARSGPGLGRLYREGLSWWHVAAAGAVAVGATWVALELTGVAVVLVVWLLTVAIAWLVRRRIPGLTGDVYGAIAELAEVGVLLSLLLLWRTT